MKLTYVVAAAGVEPATFTLWECYATTYTSLRCLKKPPYPHGLGGTIEMNFTIINQPKNQK